VAQDPIMRPYYEALEKAWSLPQITEIDDIRNNIRACSPKRLTRRRA